MNTALSVALLAVGLLLLFFGIKESGSVASEVSRFLTGSPTDRAIWMMLGGAVATILGLFGLWRGAGRKS